MTREEIKEFSGVEPNCFETDREEDWYKIGCIDGLDAADAEPNLESLWHDASDEPEYENKDILFYSEEYKEWSAKKPKELISYYLDSWSDVVEEYGIVQWGIHIRPIAVKLTL